jgi:hypothetical protein
MEDTLPRAGYPTVPEYGRDLCFNSRDNERTKFGLEASLKEIFREGKSLSLKF